MQNHDILWNFILFEKINGFSISIRIGNGFVMLRSIRLYLLSTLDTFWNLKIQFWLWSRNLRSLNCFWAVFENLDVLELNLRTLWRKLCHSKSYWFKSLNKNNFSFWFINSTQHSRRMGRDKVHSLHFGCWRYKTWQNQNQTISFSVKKWM